MTGQGRFFIVNAGAGERDNITLKGYRTLQQADLVIASQRLREQFASELEGKEVMDGGHGLFTDLALRRLSEEEAAAREAQVRAQLEAAYAAGKRIVLLESGDIALFSPYRGYLEAFRHLHPQLVPGVSSFNAANAVLAQPILGDQSHRLQLSGLQAIMQADGRFLPDVWVLFCMGLELPALLAQIRRLYPAEAQVAVILDAGYPGHELIRCAVGQLDSIADREFEFPYCIMYIFKAGADAASVAGCASTS